MTTDVVSDVSDDALAPYHVTTEARLRERVGPVADATRMKLKTSLDEFSRRFVEASPFVCVASHDAAGDLDVSPRGDDPGFVRVVDDHTLILPERTGNRLADTLTNLVARPTIGLLFLVPGCPEMLRVNGTARVVDGPPELLESFAARGRTPKLAIVVTTAEVFHHCGRAAERSRIWDHSVEWTDPRPDQLVGNTYGLADDAAKTMLDAYNHDEL